VPEMAHSGEDHGKASVVGGLDDVIVLEGPAGLDNRCGACLCRREKAIGEGEEGVAGHGHRRALGRGEAEFGHAKGGDARGIAAVHLPGTDADGAAIHGIDDGVGFNMFTDLEGEKHVGEFGIRGRAPRDDFQVGLCDDAVIDVLYQQSAGDGFIGCAARVDIGQAVCFEHAQVFLGGEDIERGGLNVGRDDDFGENFDDFGGGFCVQSAIQRDDTAEGRDRVAFKGAVVGVQHCRAGGDAAGVGVFDDGNGGGIKFGHQLERGVGVVDVVVGEFFSLQDLRGGRTGALFERCVERGALMRVFAVAHGLFEIAGEGNLARVIGILRGEPAGDCGIVTGRVGIGAGRQFFAKVEGCRAVIRGHVFEHGRIICGVGDNGDEGVIFGGGAHHGGAADIDVFDAFIVIRALGHRRGEGVEVDDDKVDIADAVVFLRAFMVGIVADGQNSAMHLWVQCFHAAIHHFGKARVIRDFLDRKARVFERLERAAGGEDFHAVFCKALREIDEAGFVGHGYQGAFDLGGGGGGHGGVFSVRVCHGTELIVSRHSLQVVGK